MISLKRHRVQTEVLVAACDAELLGRSFEEGELHLELGRRFFEGERVDVKLFLEVLALATVANLAGKRTVEAAVGAGFVDPECVITIGGVPHAQIVRM